MNFKALTFTIPRTLLAFSAVLSLTSAVMAASSFSNSLTGFTGNSTLAGTQAAVSAAGLNFYSLAGPNEDFTADPTVIFDSTGATFGTGIGGDNGRNYMRTNDSDYATVNFVAEVTFESPIDLDFQDGFMGLGAGDTALFGWPDWSTQFSSVILTPEINVDPLLTTMYTSNDTPIFANNAAPNLTSGVNRIRMTYNATAKTLDFAMDYQYAGGAFVQDQAAPTLVLDALFVPSFFEADDYTVWRDTLGSTTDLRANWDNAGASEDVIDEADYNFWKANFGQVKSPAWPDDPSRIFFGGDDGAIFRDFTVTVTSGAGAIGASAVPEPASLLLLTLGLVQLAVARRR